MPVWRLIAHTPMMDHASSRTPLLLTGATGLVGNALVARIHAEQPDRPIRILTRRPSGAMTIGGTAVSSFAWSPLQGELDHRALEGVEQVVHLAGEPVAQRWTPAARQRILGSRIDGLNLLAEAARSMDVAPRIISASAIGWYPSGEEWCTEGDAAGSGFLAEVVSQWEAAATRFGALGGGHVALRIGLVLSAQGGMLERLMPLYRWGLGAPLTSGRQWQSWVHIDDLTNMFMRAIVDDSWSGAYNAVSPHPVRQSAFSLSLAQAMGRPHFLPPVPGWVLQLRFGAATAALTASHRVRPERILEAGFTFRYPELAAALAAEV